MLISLHDVTVGEEDRDFFLSDLEVSLGDVRSSDADWPLRRGARPGVDLLDSGSITMTLCTRVGINDADQADTAVRAFMRAWRQDIDAAPGVATPMLVEAGSKSRILYGRARRIAQPSPDSAAVNQGIAVIIAEFRVLDPLVYGVSPSSVSFSVVPRSIGGIIAPIITPVTTTMTSGTEYRALRVTGDAPAPLRVIFHGPALDPVVRVVGAEVGVSGALAYDEELVVDGRAHTVTLTDGRPAAHRLTRASRLDRLSVPPGEHEVAFSATDRTGTARVTVEATPAYYHL